MKNLTLNLIILLVSSLIAFPQSTFIKTIDNIQDEESVSFISEIEPGKYLLGIHQINPNSIFPNSIFTYTHLIYLLDDWGNTIDSLIIEKLDQYIVFVWKVIKSENDDVMFLCIGQHAITSDIQLCLLHTDFDLNLTSYNFYGSPDTCEFITDFCINANQNIVFVGPSYQTDEDWDFLLWETDFDGNTVNRHIDTNYSPGVPTILELPGTNKYHVSNGGKTNFICNHNLEIESIQSLPDSNLFFNLAYRKFNLVDDFHYLMMGLQLNSQGGGTSPWDMAFYKMDENFEIDHKYIYGVMDTTDFPNNVDFIDTNRIFFGGVKNYTNQPPEDSWMSIYITNLQGDTITSRYYGGYGSYNVGTGLATSDGGYIYGVRWFDFANYIPPNPIDWDIVIMKVNSEGLLTNINTPMPFEVTDIIVFPNPGTDNLKISSTFQHIQLKLYDIQGVLIADRIFDYSISLDTKLLKPGTYFYQILQNKKELKTGKWLKK